MSVSSPKALGGSLKLVFRSPLEDRVVRRAGMATEDFQPMFSLSTVMLLVDSAQLAMSEPAAVQMMSMVTEGHAETLMEYHEAVKRGDTMAIATMANKISIEYLAQSLRSSSMPYLKKVGETLVGMVEWAESKGKIVELRPEGVLNWFGNVMLKAELLEETIKRLDQNKVSMEDILLMNQKENVYTSVMKQQEFRLILELSYKKYSVEEIAKQVKYYSENQIRDIQKYYRYNEETGEFEERSFFARILGKLDRIANEKLGLNQLKQFFKNPTIKGAKNLMIGLGAAGASITLGGVMGSHSVALFMTILAPILQAVGFAGIGALEANTMSPILFDQEGNVYQGGVVTKFTMNPEANIIASILMVAGVYLTDYMELGSGMFSGFPSGIDMDWINVIMSGMQAGMMDLGLCYVSEDTLADLVKPFLGVVGLQGGLISAGIFEAIGLISCLPQADQFYKERIWPLVKLSIGAQLMGGIKPILSSAFANTIAMNAINVVEQAFMNVLWEEPALNGATMDFSAILEYLPSCGGYDYISNYITHNVYGVW